MINERLLAICRHDLRLEEVYDRYHSTDQRGQNHSVGFERHLRQAHQKHRVNAREILSGYMLTCLLVFGIPFEQPDHER